MSVEARTNLRVHVTCDACRCRYHYDLPVSGRAIVREGSAVRDLKAHIQKRVDDSNLPHPDAPHYKECPGCGYIPEWMTRAAARRTALRRAATLFVVPFLAVLAAGAVAGNRDLGLPGLVAAVVCFGTMFIAAPLALLLTPASAAKKIEAVRQRWAANHPRPTARHRPDVSIVGA